MDGENGRHSLTLRARLYACVFAAVFVSAMTSTWLPRDVRMSPAAAAFVATVGAACLFGRRPSVWGAAAAATAAAVSGACGTCCVPADGGRFAWAAEATRILFDGLDASAGVLVAAMIAAGVPAAVGAAAAQGAVRRLGRPAGVGLPPAVRALLDSNALPMKVDDTATGRTTAANDAWLAMVGRTASEVVGVRWDAGVAAADLPAERGARVEAMAVGRAGPCERRYGTARRSGGEAGGQASTAWLVRPDPDGSLLLTAVVEYDGSRAATAGAAVVADEVRRRDEFLAMLGHELRNPLASILSAAELIGGGSGGVADRARYRSVVREQVAVLRRLVDDLLDAARIRQGKVRIVPEPADIRDVVSAAVEQVTPAADARRHRVCLAMPEAPVWSECDPDRMRQVVGNLLENAVKYTEPGGTVWVVVERVAGGGRCEIRVRDTGRGIDPAFLPHVFDVFSQGPEAAGSGDRASGGLGLGLALVRRLVELHGGEVTAASPGPGEGSEFVVSLPLRTLQWRPSTPTPPPPTPPAGRLRVLLADDDYAGSDMLGTLLRTEGHDVCVVHDGDSAMATAATFRPDVVLLDIGMPGRDGFDVAGRLAGGDAVLVAVTGYGGDDDRRRGEESGFDRYLVKPVDIGLLRRVFGEVASGVLRRGGRPRKAVTP